MDARFQLRGSELAVFTADCWFLTGPTGVGKSRIALGVARSLDCEIIALDSMTFYRGMDVGTAKPSRADQAAVPHHLIDCLEPTDSASVDWYLKAAQAAVERIRDRGRQPMFVGGTPLYLKAALRGLFDGPPADLERRDRLEEEAKKNGLSALHARLAKVDAKAAAKIHPNDQRRIVRALEVFEITGRPISHWQAQFDLPANPAPKVVCLTRPRDELYRRIDVRVLEMFENGWVDEVRNLLNRESTLSREAAQAVGYREIADLLAGRMDEPTAIKQIQQRTRRFAKHQLTWFRHIEEIRWLPIEGNGETAERSAIEEVQRRFSGNCK